MCQKNNVKRVLIMSSVISMALFNQPLQWAYASADLTLAGGHHGRYNEVVVGNDKYYYNAGTFYRGQPGHYVAVEAPVGAVVENVPSNYERVEVNGTPYLRYGNTYYRHGDHGYEVVRTDKSREHGGNNWRGDEDHRNDHH